MIKLGVCIFAMACCAGNAQADVRFSCPSQFVALEHGVHAYLYVLKIPTAQVVQTVDAESGVLTLTLTTAVEDTRTLDFFTRPEYTLATEPVRLPAAGGKFRIIDTVSRKEIMLALLQHGRVTEFSGDACSLTALADHVGIRQNIVAWTENLNWVWPDGGPARWNSKFWTRGTPKHGVPAHAALMDAFLNQDKYSIGCYTATKLVVAHGMLDYYRRVKPDPLRARHLEKALLADGEPLVDIEPAIMWSFERDFDPLGKQHPGKLLTLDANVAPGNFVPGDWGYLLNTDSATDRKTGYEGSNAIYLGRNMFDDYYNDHKHAYTYEQKLNEVYQWRNGVFNRIRDAHKAKLLTGDDLNRLSTTPATGGIQLDFRVGPRYF